MFIFGFFRTLNKISSGLSALPSAVNQYRVLEKNICAQENELGLVKDSGEDQGCPAIRKCSFYLPAACMCPNTIAPPFQDLGSDTGWYLSRTTLTSCSLGSVPKAIKQNITPTQKIQKQLKLTDLKILMNVRHTNTLFKEWTKAVFRKHLMYG